MKNNKSLILTIALSISLLYVVIATSFTGFQKSISKTYLKLKPAYRWTFRLMMLGNSFAIAYAGDTTLFYISGALLSLVGFFPHIEVRWKAIIHMIGAIGGITTGFIAVNPQWWMYLCTIATITILIFITKFWLYFTEIVVLLIIFTYIYLGIYF